MTREQQMMDSAKLAEQNSRTIDLSKKQVFISAYIQGWLEADSHSQWISVEDELPTIPENYICVEVIFKTKYGANNLGKYFGDKWISYEDYTYKTEDISYWMLLPEPPKKMSNINKDIYEQQQAELAFAKRMIQNSFYGNYCVDKLYCGIMKNVIDEMIVNDLVQMLENMFNIPEGKHLFAVFENNESDEIKGFIIAECVDGARFPKGNISDYPLLSSAELIEKYKK